MPDSAVRIDDHNSGLNIGMHITGPDARRNVLKQEDIVATLMPMPKRGSLELWI